LHIMFGIASDMIFNPKFDDRWKKTVYFRLKRY
jgi:hypothetical protein